MTFRAFNKIIAGLADALAFAKGDLSRGELRTREINQFSQNTASAKRETNTTSFFDELPPEKRALLREYSCPEDRGDKGNGLTEAE